MNFESKAERLIRGLKLLNLKETTQEVQERQFKENFARGMVEEPDDLSLGDEMKALDAVIAQEKQLAQKAA